MVGTALDRKLMRDLGLWRGQIVAIALIIACGIAVFTAMQSVYDSLFDTLAQYYQQYHSADVYARLTRAPAAQRETIARLPGIGAVRTRTVQDVLVDVPGRAEPTTLRMIGVPDARPPEIDGIAIRQGAYVDARDAHQIIVSEAFAQANRLHVGSRLRALLNGRRWDVAIAGIALSPEYVYEIRGATDIWPDAEHFGVAWVADSVLATAFDMRDGFNDVAATLTPGANMPDVLARLDAVLAPYGGTGAFSKADQASNRFLNDELEQLRVQALLIPAIFLGVASFLLNVALGRLVALQRNQIAILRAVGYPAVTIAVHYLKAALFVIAIGVCLGLAAGAWLGLQLTAIYTHFFHFPLLQYHLRATTALASFAIAIVAGTAGVATAVRHAFSLAPAEAMRPPSPPVFRQTIVERLGLQALLSPPARIMLRNIERRKAASSVTIGAVACAVAIMIVGRSGYDSIELMTRIQFSRASREDATIAFTKPLSASARYDVRSLPGVLEADPYRAVAVRLSNGRFSKRVALLGLSPSGTLRRAIGATGRVAPFPAGLMLTDALREALRIPVGGEVTISVLEGTKRTFRLPVIRSVDEIIGLNAYLPGPMLARSLREDALLSGAFVTIDRTRLGDFDRAVKNVPAIASVSYRAASLRQFRKTIAEGMGISIAFLIAFGSIIAAGAVYNAGRLALSERARELSTLRVLGYSRWEAALILLGEQAILVTIGVPAGFGLGHLFNWGLEPFYRSETYRVPITVAPATYAFSTAVIAAAALFSAVIVARQLWRFEISAVLKSAE